MEAVYPGQSKPVHRSIQGSKCRVKRKREKKKEREKEKMANITQRTCENELHIPGQLPTEAESQLVFADRKIN